MHKMNLYKIILIILMVFVGTLNQIDAKIYNAFTTKAIKPKNQIDNKVGYFDLKVKSNARQSIFIDITNQGKEKMNAMIKVNNATTANNGGIIYTKNIKKDSSLKKGLSEYVNIVTPTVVVEAKKTQRVEIELNIDKEEFKGSILGGIVVTAETEGKDDSKSKKDTGIKTDNEVAFVTAIKVTMSNDKVDTNLNLLETKGDLVDYKTAVSAILQNNMPIIMKGASVKGEIFKKDSSTAISKTDLRTVDIAPNSNFKVVYDWKNNRLQNGVYRIKMEAHHKGKTWKWDEEFTIKNAEDINKNAFKLNTDYTIYIIIGAIAIISLLILLILLKRRKKKKEE